MMPSREDDDLSPVDQILALQKEQQGRSLLDSRPASKPIPRWLWLLPLALALPGGLIAWLLVIRENRAAAWWMLALGVAVTLMSLGMVAPFTKVLGL